MHKPMKFNKFNISLCALSALALGFTSCIDDGSTYGDLSAMPTISVNTGAPDGETPVVNNYIGSETVITPAIRYDGTAPLSYEWSIQNLSGDNSFEVVSTEPEFRYKFPVGGVWYVNLTITDGTVGYTQAYEVNVNRPFEKGYCLISNTGDGVGNLVFLKDMTPEEIEEGAEPVVIENILDRVTSMPLAEKLIDIKLIHPSWPLDAKARLMVSTSGRCYYLDPNNFTVVAELVYGDVVSGFNATALIPFSTEALAYDSATKRFVTLKANDMIACEETVWKGNSFDTFSTVSYTSWGSIQFDIAYIDISPLQVYNRGYDYSVGAYLVRPSKHMIDDEFINVFGGPQKTVTVDDPYYGPYEDTVYPFYFITRNKATGDIYWNFYSGFGAYDVDAPVLNARKVVGNASSAVPATGSKGAASDLYNRSYYYNGNHVYVMIEGTDGINTLPSPSQWALEYPDSQEITYIGMDKTSAAGEEILMVATADKATGRGNVYFYDPRNVRTDNPGAAPLKTYVNCADRITDIFYKKRV